MQVAGRQRHVLCKRAASLANAKNRAVAAVLAHSSRAEVAATAADIDLSGDAPADPLAILWSAGRLDDANELVTRNPAKAGVALEQLQIRAADARHTHADTAFAVVVGNGHIAKRQRG